MELTLQRRLAGQVLGCSPKRVIFNPENLKEIKEAITKADIRGLVNSGIITMLPARGVSRVRARHRAQQRRKKLQRGHGKRKGSAHARLSTKRQWINRVRKQRDALKELRRKGQLDTKTFRELYLKSKGGFFRSRHHLIIYIEEHHLTKAKTQ